MPLLLCSLDACISFVHYCNNFITGFPAFGFTSSQSTLNAATNFSKRQIYHTTSLLKAFHWPWLGIRSKLHCLAHRSPHYLTLLTHFLPLPYMPPVKLSCMPLITHFAHQWAHVFTYVAPLLGMSFSGKSFCIMHKGIILSRYDFTWEILYKWKGTMFHSSFDLSIMR